MIVGSCAAASAPKDGQFASDPGCEHLSPQQCVGMAMEAMGGRERMEKLKSVSNTLLTEQSYRQAPFITSFEHEVVTLDLVGQRTLTEAKVTWPESDLNKPDSEATVLVSPGGGVYELKGGDSPCGLGTQNAAREKLGLGPVRILLTAASAPDLHFETPETVRQTSHAVVAFTWGHLPVRLLLNPQLDPREHPHRDHGYAVASHSSQGQTAERVLIHVDTDWPQKTCSTAAWLMSPSRTEPKTRRYTPTTARNCRRH